MRTRKLRNSSTNGFCRFPLVLAGCCLLLSGCVGISQLSAKVIEVDRAHYYISLQDAVEGYRAGEDALFKCPVFAYKKVFCPAWVFVVEPAPGEKFRYERLSSGPVGHVFVRCNRLFDRDVPRKWDDAWLKRHVGLCARAEAEPFFSGEKLSIPVTDEALEICHDQFKVFVEEGSCHAVWQALAVFTGIVIDAPLSLGMTALAMTPVAGGFLAQVVDDSARYHASSVDGLHGRIIYDFILRIGTDESAYIQKIDASDKDG